MTAKFSLKRNNKGIIGFTLPRVLQDDRGAARESKRNFVFMMGFTKGLCFIFANKSICKKNEQSDLTMNRLRT